MDELKLLVEMVASLPAMAVWVIAFFFVYKVVVIGSIYGLIRFSVDKAHSWLTTPKHAIHTKEIRAVIDGMCIRGQADVLIAQLSRLRGKATGIKSEYIHEQSVQWLREAIDEKTVRDTQSKAA